MTRQKKLKYFFEEASIDREIMMTRQKKLKYFFEDDSIDREIMMTRQKKLTPGSLPPI